MVPLILASIYFSHLQQVFRVWSPSTDDIRASNMHEVVVARGVEFFTQELGRFIGRDVMLTTACHDICDSIHQRGFMVPPNYDDVEAGKRQNYD